MGLYVRIAIWKVAMLLVAGCFSAAAAYVQADSAYQSSSTRIVERLKKKE